MSAHASDKRSGLWSLPVLRNFGPPEDIPAASSGKGSSLEVMPWSLPGSPLRTNARAASSGYYAPVDVGAPTSTRQAEILNTALIGPPTGTEGVVIGRDVLSRTPISHDPITAYNAVPRLISSPNVISMGDVGAGKSSGTKCNYVERPLLLVRRRAVIFDKKNQGGEGEYAGMARAYGSEPIRFAVDGTGTTLNILDPIIARGSGTKGQFRLIRNVAQLANEGDALSKWEDEAVRAALRATLAQYEAGRVPVMADVLPHLGKIASDSAYAELSSDARDRLHQAGLSVRWMLTGLLDEYAGLLDGETSREVDLASKLTSFDISQLPDEGPAIPVVMSMGHMWLLGRLRAETGWRTNVIYEEGWHMIAGPSVHLVKSSQKLSRGLGISNVFVMHKGTDIPRDSPGMTIIQEAQTVHVYRQSRPEDALWCQKTFGLAPETAGTIEELRDGHFIFKYGSQPETHVQHIRSAWERELTNTDEAMAGVEIKARA